MVSEKMRWTDCGRSYKWSESRTHTSYISNPPCGHMWAHRDMLSLIKISSLHTCSSVTLALSSQIRQQCCIHGCRGSGGGREFSRFSPGSLRWSQTETDQPEGFFTQRTNICWRIFTANKILNRYNRFLFYIMHKHSFVIKHFFSPLKKPAWPVRWAFDL